MNSSVRYLFTFFLVSLIFVLNNVEGQANQRRRTRPRPRQRLEGGLPHEIQEAYLSAIDNHDSTTTATTGDDANEPEESIRSAGNPLWNVYAPSTPASNAVECYVEVVSVRSQGGRCTRLGGMARHYICQSGQHFEFKPECQQILEARNSEIAGP